MYGLVNHWEHTDIMDICICSNPFPLLLNSPNNKNTLTQIHPELAPPFKTHFELGGGSGVLNDPLRNTLLTLEPKFLSL